MLKQALKSYRWSILLLLIVAALTLIFSPGFEPMILFIKSIRWGFFILAGVGGFIAAFSFFFPYWGISRLEKKSGRIFPHLLKSVFLDCMGSSPHKYMLGKLGVKNIDENQRKLLAADLTAVLLISLCFVGFTGSLRPFFLCWILAGASLAAWYWSRVGFSKGLLFLTFMSVLRYPLELAKIIPLLLAINLPLSPLAVVLFLTTTSMLYFVPGFRSAVGLLSIYFVSLYLFLGINPILGLLGALIFRLNAALLYVAPYILKGVFAK